MLTSITARWPLCLLAATVTVLSVSTSPVLAQAYPSKAVRIVVPYAPGGGIDVVVRLIAQQLSEPIGQSVVVDNRGGGAGVIGTEIVARAPADGYTLLAIPNSHAINAGLQPRLPYDTLKDFASIVQIGSSPNILLIHPSVPARTVADLVKLARARPHQLSYASSGNGSGTHLAAELFKMLAKVDLLHVPYRGGGPALTDLLGGQVSMYFSSLPAAMPYVRSGRLKGLGVTSQKRASAVPETPSLAESGVPGFESSGWYGLIAPAATPQAVTARVNGEVNKILKTRAFAEKLATDGTEPVGGTPEEFAAFLRTEIAKWTEVVKHARISPD